MFPKLFFAVSLLAVAVSFPAHGQSTPFRKPEAAKTIPRTPDGHPDLQGTWLNNSATPLERPRGSRGSHNAHGRRGRRVEPAGEENLCA